MLDFDEINPHRALWQSETHVSTEERRWERFCRQLEAKLGHGLDGDQTVDGYSLDYLFGLFEHGYTVAEAATEVAAWKASL